MEEKERVWLQMELDRRASQWWRETGGSRSLESLPSEMRGALIFKSVYESEPQFKPGDEKACFHSTPGKSL